MSWDPLRIHLSLVSHTNIGKTTLARTLLSRDIGTIADRAHVTETTDDYVLVRNAEGCELVLWDTPGFGNSIALARRLQGRDNPIGWFMSEVWDRVANKTQWLNQRALKHVKETSDVVLYLVNAAELPDEAPYVKAEMRILEWVGKPVVVLLNQMGEPKPAEQEAQDVKRWQDAMQTCPIVSGVLSMDAFARCWVQEFELFNAIGSALNEEQQVSFEGLRDIWARQRRDVYSSSIQAMGYHLDRLIHDRELAPARSIKDQLLAFGHRIGVVKHDDGHDPLHAAQTALSARATDAFCALTDELVKLNGLKGKGVRKEILRRLQTDWNVTSQIDPKQAAVAGAIGSDAVGGLASDLATGGLSVGLGTLIGTLIGALGGAGLAVAYNHSKAPEGTAVSWSDKAIKDFLCDAVLLYLAIAHFGRGRGNWTESEYPDFWKELTTQCIEQHAPDDINVLPNRIDQIVRGVLFKLYPNAEF